MKPTAFRWVVCGLLFLATTINYVDRQVLGMLEPRLRDLLHWDKIEYGYINSAFSAAYALGMLLVGRLMDRWGTRVGFAVSMIFWSLAAMGHALARSALGFGIARFLLGFGEAGNFPAAIKTVAEWFPKKERALATGIFNSGSNLAPILVPLAVPWIAVTYGWQAAFIATGAAGFVWLAAWLALYGRPEKHPRVSPEELHHIQSDPPEPVERIPWAKLWPERRTWAFALGKFMTDPVWWFYMIWLPGFLYDRHGLKITQMGLPLIVIYLAADVGSIGAGWLSSRLIKGGWSATGARKAVMLLCALCVVPVMFAARVSDLRWAVGLIALAAAAHQGWSANLFTMVSDMFPSRAVGSVVGIGGMAGAVGGMLFPIVTGHVLEWTKGNYFPLFIVCGTAYLAALLTIHRLVPRGDMIK